MKAAGNGDAGNDGIHVTFGVGGEHGAQLLGPLKFLEENGVKIKSETGVSAGSLVAAFHKNGYTARQIAKIMHREFSTGEGRQLLDAVQGPARFGAWLRGRAFEVRSSRG